MNDGAKVMTMNMKCLMVCATMAGALVCTAAEPLPKNAGFETPDAKGGAADWSLYGNGMWSVKRGEGRNGTTALICADVGKGGWTTQWVVFRWRPCPVSVGRMEMPSK